MGADEGRVVRVADLLGLTELSAILNLSYTQTVKLAREEPGFPEPVKTLRATRLWDASEVLAWIDGRVKGRPGPKLGQKYPNMSKPRLRREVDPTDWADRLMKLAAKPSRGGRAPFNSPVRVAQLKQPEPEPERPAGHDGDWLLGVLRGKNE